MTKQTSPKYSPEVRERAVRMVFEVRRETGEHRGGVARVAAQLGINKETLRNWVNQAEVDEGRRPGVTTHDQRRIAELEREVRELRRANEILKAASAFFARELDPRPRDDPLRRHPPRALRGRADLVRRDEPAWRRRWKSSTSKG